MNHLGLHTEVEVQQNELFKLIFHTTRSPLFTQTDNIE